MATISPLRTAFEAKRPRPWIGLLAIRVLGERYEAGMGTSYVKSGGSERRSTPDTPPPLSLSKPRGRPVGMAKSCVSCEDATRVRRESQAQGGRMSKPAIVPSARNEVRQVIPRLIEITETLLYPDIWERPGLSKRDRSLITVAALTAMYRPEQLKGHTERALANGVSKEEISEIITHMAFYAGWPSAMSAAKVVKQVFEEETA